MRESCSFARLAIVALATVGIACSTTSSGDNRGTGGKTPSQSGGVVGSGGRTGAGGATATSSGGSGSGGKADGGAGGAAAGGSQAGSGGAASGGAAGSSATNGGSSGTTSTNPATGGSAGTAGQTSTAGGSGGGASGSGGTGPAGSTGTQVCPAQTGGPDPIAQAPSPAQLAYQRTEMTAFIHFGMATYDGTEQCNPADPVSTFAPTKLDATTVGTWVTSLKGAGFKQAMLVTKHSCGFVLWPSKYTDYSTKNSTWKGDILQLWSDAMKANDMRIAIYYSPWDQHYTSDKSDYETYLKNQLTELMAYGTPVEFEFDGFHAPTGGNVNWKNVFSFIKQAQPNALIWAGPEIVNTGAIPDLQWIGNENGEADTKSRTTAASDTHNCGGGKNYCPNECNTSSHRPNWFWHPGSSPISLADMQKNYFDTVGMNCTFNFNIPPSTTGEFDPKDISLLQSFGTWYSGLYKTNLVKGETVTADSTWATAGFEASKAVDDDICTYWAGASGKTSGTLEVTPAAPINAKLISIREAIELGERVTKYHVEIKTNGAWTALPTDSSGYKIQGTVIGNRQLWQLKATTVEAIRLVIESAKSTPAIAEFAVY